MISPNSSPDIALKYLVTYIIYYILGDVVNVFTCIFVIECSSQPYQIGSLCFPLSNDGTRLENICLNTPNLNRHMAVLEIELRPR